jgi:tetrahydromethanopterin S-methyltransferase subunit A
VPLPCIETFRQQVELVDCTGETEIGVLVERTRTLAGRAPGRFPSAWDVIGRKMSVVDDAHDREGRSGQFVSIRPSGKREPLSYDPKGFFVITVDRTAGEIVCRHYLSDNTPAHEMRGRLAEPMLLGLVREKLVSQLSHAGYLGGELAKAEAALRLGLRYEQDQLLRQ